MPRVPRIAIRIAKRSRGISGAFISAVSPLSSLPFHNSLVNTQGHLRGSQPIELLCPLKTFHAHGLAIFRIIQDLSEGFNQGLSVEGIKQQARVADDFREAGPVSGNYRYATLHRFDYGQTKAFKIRRGNETTR